MCQLMLSILVASSLFCPTSLFRFRNKKTFKSTGSRKARNMTAHMMKSSEALSLVAQPATGIESNSSIYANTFVPTVSRAQSGQSDQTVQPSFGKPLGAGSYGEVWEGSLGDQEVAIKTERINAPKNQRVLTHEAMMLERLQGGVGIPKLFGYGQTQEVLWMAMERLHVDLEEHRHESAGATLDVEEITDLAINMFLVLESMHDQKVVHLDIKPDNFMLDEKGNLFIIDFGLARLHGVQVPRNVTSGGSKSGSPRYMSIYSMRGYKQSYRDDAISTLYTLIYLSKGGLPWQGISIPGDSSDAVMQKILMKKEATTIEQLCDSLPAPFRAVGLPHAFQEALHHCNRLEWGERPDYEYLRSRFEQMRRERS